MADFQEFSAPIKYGATIGQALANTVSGDARVDSTGSLTLLWSGTLVGGLPFIASQTSLGTPSFVKGVGTVTVLAGSTVGGRTAYVTGFAVKNTSYIGMAGGSIFIGDSSGTIIWVFPTSSLQANTTITASGTPVQLLRYDCSAGSSNMGIVIGCPASGSITSDGSISVSVWGILK